MNKKIITFSFLLFFSYAFLELTLYDAVSLQHFCKSMMNHYKKRFRIAGTFFSIVIEQLKRFKYIIHAAYRICTFVEQCLLISIQFKVNDLFPSITTDCYRYTKANIFLSIFTFQRYAAGK